MAQSVCPQYFNPRIPYGMRLSLSIFSTVKSKFQSTHPVWDATHGRVPFCQALAFQSTHPVWDATGEVEYVVVLELISIHASRMGCDQTAIHPIVKHGISIHASRMGCDGSVSRLMQSKWNFNPRIPYGMRPVRITGNSDDAVFQSTHPVWDATHHPKVSINQRSISIHASRMGCDHAQGHGDHGPRISIHASRMGCDMPADVNSFWAK